MLGSFEVPLVDWELCLRASVLGSGEFGAIGRMDTGLADVFAGGTEPVREFTGE